MKRPLNNARRQEQLDSRALATETTGELHILRVDRDPPGVDRAEVRIVKQADEVGLGRLLQRHDRVALELQVLLDLKDAPSGRLWCAASSSASDAT